jgi:DNA-binding Lrp family transcriptional regulator
MEEILKLLQENARLFVVDIAAMTNKTEDEVRSVMKELEDNGTIVKYAAIVNPQNVAKKTVKAIHCRSRDSV